MNLNIKTEKFFGKYSMELKETFEYQFSFSQEDVSNFSIITGDDNPIHIDEEKARKVYLKSELCTDF